MVNAMLLNEFLKRTSDRAGTERDGRAAEEPNRNALLTGLQKVSAQLEMSNPSPKVVANKPQKF